jgi:hypothetical protein
MPIEPYWSSEDNEFLSRNLELPFIYTFRLIFNASLQGNAAVWQCGWNTHNTGTMTCDV